MLRFTPSVRLQACSLVLLLPISLCAQELAISNVRPSAKQVDLSKDRSTNVQFDLSAPAKVRLQIYDGRDLLVSEVFGSQVFPHGTHVLRWDLQDSTKRTVPAEAYTYVLEASASDGKSVRYDLADQTGGQSIEPREARWDAASGTVSYVLDRPARVNVRVGLSNGGPLLRTLVDWVVRPAGLQNEKWDGKDASGVLDLSRHPRLAISVQAFSLPENSIIVGTPQERVLLIDGLPRTNFRQKSRTAPKRMYAHAQQSLESRGDFQIHLDLPTTLRRAENGLPIVSSAIAVRLTVSSKDLARAHARRFEPVFFVDGQFAFENEVGFVPMTWNFDPTVLNEGEHYLTANLRGYEGNFGMATVKIWVKR